MDEDKIEATGAPEWELCDEEPAVQENQAGLGHSDWDKIQEQVEKRIPVGRDTQGHVIQYLDELIPDYAHKVRTSACNKNAQQIHVWGWQGYKLGLTLGFHHFQYYHDMSNVALCRSATPRC